jgi:hypothetical protein
MKTSPRKPDFAHLESVLEQKRQLLQRIKTRWLRGFLEKRLAIVDAKLQAAKKGRS